MTKPVSASAETAEEKGMMIRGRFSAPLTKVMEKINASIGFDHRMAAQDIAASIAHCTMLAAQNIISAEDHEKIVAGLGTIRGELERGEFTFSYALEDIHMNIEQRLAELIGSAAGRLHTARSRNDQVATDFRLWVRAAHDRAIGLLENLIAALLDRAEEYAATVMPGYTHLQSGQPVTFGHHLMAYVEMFGRDLGRLTDSRRRMNESPLGAAALAGTSFPIDRAHTTHALGFTAPMRNSMDAVSDRDFALEYLAAASLCAVHLSRLSEEIVLWMSPQFRFITLSDAWTTGSSIMPQKRNPDAAEIIRGKAGRIVGSLQGLLMVMKGLPLTFSKDMQEDKERTFDAADTLDICLEAMIGMVRDWRANAANMEQAAGGGHATATDLADWLVREINLPFREAHHAVGQLVQLADAKGKGLADLSLDEMRGVDARIKTEVMSVLTVESSVNSRCSFGGTAPDNVRAQILFWRQRLAEAG